MGKATRQTPRDTWDAAAYDRATDFAAIVSHSSTAFADRIYMEPAEPEFASITFRQLGDFVRGFGAFLDENNVHFGDRCAFISHNSTVLAMEFVATMATGRVFVPLNPNSSIDEINFILEDSSPKALIYDDSLEEKVDAVHDWCPTISVTSGPEFVARIIALGKALKSPGQTPAGDSIAEIVYTSGSTGHPKGVLLTHRNLITDVFGIGQVYNYSAEDRYLTVAPMFHNSGQIPTTLPALICGAPTTVIRTDMGFINLWHYITQYRPTWTFVMTAHVALMLERINKVKDNPLKGMFVGGGPLALEMQLKFEKQYSTPVYTAYGLTESTSFATCTRPGEADRTSGSAGKPLPVNEVRIFKREGEVPTGVVGEIRIRGNNVCAGYLNQPEITRQKIRNGWLHTGDLGYFNDEGALFVVDRLDNMVIVGGENVYPTEIERLLPELPGIKEGIVLSLPDRIMDHELVMVYRGTGEEPRIKEWKEYLLQKLTSFKVPRRFIDSRELGFEHFPTTDNGKVKRRTLQKALEEKFGVSKPADAAAGDVKGLFIADKSRALVAEVLQLDDVRDDQSMENTPGWDSIRHLQLVMALEQTFGVSFTPSQIARITNLPSIVSEVSKLNPQ